MRNPRVNPRILRLEDSASYALADGGKDWGQEYTKGEFQTAMARRMPGVEPGGSTIAEPRYA